MTTTDKRTDVTLYSASFRGVYGRNRSNKFACQQPREVAPTVPASDGTEAFMGVDVASMARDYATKIRARAGVVRVTRYDGCEVYADGIQVIPITQGVIVYNEQV